MLTALIMLLFLKTNPGIFLYCLPDKMGDLPRPGNKKTRGNRFFIYCFPDSVKHYIKKSPGTFLK